MYSTFRIWLVTRFARWGYYGLWRCWRDVIQDCAQCKVTAILDFSKNNIEKRNNIWFSFVLHRSTSRFVNSSRISQNVFLAFSACHVSDLLWVLIASFLLSTSCFNQRWLAITSVLVLYLYDASLWRTSPIKSLIVINIITHEFSSPMGGVHIASTGKLISVRFPYCAGSQVRDQSFQDCNACKWHILNNCQQR